MHNQLIEHIGMGEVKYFRKLKPNEQGIVLLSLSPLLQENILSKLSNKEIINFLHYLDFDDITDILQKIPEKRRQEILHYLDEEARKKVEFLLSFDPDSAAGIMNIDYIEVSRYAKFSEVISRVKRHEDKTGKFPTILVVEDGYLVGELPGHELALHSPNKSITFWVVPLPAIKYNEGIEKVLEIFKDNKHEKAVVLNDDYSVLGIIYSHDVLKILSNRSAHTLSNFAGVSDEEDILDNVNLKVEHRYRWLIINLGTAFLAAAVVGLFQDTISKWVLLAVYMPIVAGMGGNAATQTLAVMVRGMTLNEVNRHTAKKIILREAIAGAINGIINGIIVALVAIIFDHSPLLGLITALAMIINLIIAGIAGAIIPMIMKKLGKDPASSATIFITTATDVCGFFSFLGLATLFLGV